MEEGSVKGKIEKPRRDFGVIEWLAGEVPGTGEVPGKRTASSETWVGRLE